MAIFILLTKKILIFIGYFLFLFIIGVLAIYIRGTIAGVYKDTPAKNKQTFKIFVCFVIVVSFSVALFLTLFKP